MSVNALNSQMHEKMTIRLTELRGRISSRIIAAGERVKHRPQLDGDDTWSKIKSSNVLQQDETGAMIVGFAMGIPGLDGAMETIADVAMEMCGDRKAVHMRPQDHMEYSTKAEATIREDNRQDYSLFMNLNQKLDMVNAALASGNLWGILDKETGDFNILDQDCTISAPKPESQKTQEYGMTFGMNSAPASHMMQANYSRAPRFNAV